MGRGRLVTGRAIEVNKWVESMESEWGEWTDNIGDEGLVIQVLYIPHLFLMWFYCLLLGRVNWWTAVLPHGSPCVECHIGLAYRA